MAKARRGRGSLKHSKSILFRLLSYAALVIIGLSWFWLDVKSLDLAGEKEECNLQELEHSNQAEALAYSRLLHHVFPKVGGSNVVLITLTPKIEPLSVLTNTCEGRKFFTALVPVIAATFHPTAIAIDKFYSQGACPDDNKDEASTFGMSVSQVAHGSSRGGENESRYTNDLFSTALNGVDVPVIVGQATEVEERRSDGSCLVLTPAFVFKDAGRREAELKSNVQYGLTRLNENSLQIPLQWPVSKAGTASKEPDYKDGFALATVKGALHGALPNQDLQYFLTAHQHPFALFRDDDPPRNPDYPPLSALDVLCQLPSGRDAVAAHNWGTCKPGTADLSALQGKVVVIGEHIDTDLQPFPQHDRFGVNLQASYIDALISGHFVRELYYRMDWTLVLSWLAAFAAVDLLTPKTKATNELRVLLFGFVLLGVFCLGSYLLLMRYQMFTPIFLLSLYPITIYLLLRFGWWIITTLRERTSTT